MGPSPGPAAAAAAAASAAVQFVAVIGAVPLAGVFVPPPPPPCRTHIAPLFCLCPGPGSDGMVPGGIGQKRHKVY
ncbi:hypothetical protein JYU34_002094 [Plutella xylostella]|uniref:Secreted protein n=1 Tax=Plutella xylostella TaxID=51655 RepID=A0ABQ7R1C8_PLUXY|nr:hypothetical protein JYU34_002094 [Plutella xylostella]